jgi:hypothetical protein
MKDEIYVINSPSFPERKDFERFNAWCQWDSPEEIPYIKSLCTSEKDYDEYFMRPYEKGKDAYYPTVDSSTLPNHSLLYVKVDVKITDSIIVMGFVSIVESEIVALTICPDENPDNEIDFYRRDREVADDENPESVYSVMKWYGVAT